MNQNPSSSIGNSGTAEEILDFIERSLQGKRKDAPSPVYSSDGGEGEGATYYSDDSFTLAGLPSTVVASSVSRHKDDGRTLPYSKRGKQKVKSVDCCCVDDERKPSAKPKVSIAQDNSSLCVTVAAAVVTREAKASAYSSGSIFRICFKEGCNTKLTGKQRNRCKDHQNKCKERGCEKVLKNAKSGLCQRHDSLDSKQVKLCQKEGCHNLLKGHQTTRCAQHFDKCKRQGCMKDIVHFKLGLCRSHYQSLTTRICQKEDCNMILVGKERFRCKEHRKSCKVMGCKKTISNYGSGLCQDHHREANRALSEASNDQIR